MESKYEAVQSPDVWWKCLKVWDLHPLHNVLSYKKLEWIQFLAEGSIIWAPCLWACQGQRPYVGWLYAG